jgi:hypothetical protein
MTKKGKRQKAKDESQKAKDERLYLLPLAL